MAALVLNGCGAIGRSVVRTMLMRSRLGGHETRDLRLINDPAFRNPKQLLEHIILGANDRHERVILRERLTAEDSCLRWDPHSVSVPIEVTGYKDPRELANRYRIMTELDSPLIVLDCSRFAAEDPNFVRAHLEAGATRVVISAPARESDITVVYGVNENELTPGHRIISAASCTTNCLALPLSVVSRHFGIRNGFAITVHAATSEQAVYDVASGEPTKGRSLFGVTPWPTGAAKLVGKMLGIEKFDGFALRIPLANGSIAVAILNTDSQIDTKQLRAAFRNAATDSLKGIMNYSTQPLTHRDVLIDHSDVASVVDERLTGVLGGFTVVTAWYDNIDGYVANLVNLIEAVARLGAARSARATATI